MSLPTVSPRKEAWVSGLLALGLMARGCHVVVDPKAAGPIAKAFAEGDVMAASGFSLVGHWLVAVLFVAVFVSALKRMR